MDRVEIDGYDNGHRLTWPALYINRNKNKVKQIRLIKQNGNLW